MLMIKRSLSLKVEAKTGRILITWIAKESKGDTYTCVRKYMILLLDENNNPLQEILYSLLREFLFNTNLIKNFVSLEV